MESLISVQEGNAVEIVTINRKVKQPKRVLTDDLISLVHSYLEDNQTKPRKQRLSGTEIHRIVQARGYQISYSSIRDIIHDWKDTHRHRDVFILQDPPEGYRAEFDWGYVDLTLGNVIQKISLAIFTLNYSQYRFGRLYLNQTTFDVIQAHIDFFNEIKVVPKVIFYDNATTIYDLRKKQYNQRFLLCATHYQFTPNVCNPASPHEKGSTEKSVSVVRNLPFADLIR